MKKIISLVLLVTILFLLLLTGCGSDKKVSDNSGGQQDSQPVQTQEEKKETESKENVTIKFTHYQSEGQETFLKIIEKFQAEYPNIKIEADLSGGDQYPTILKTKLAAGEASDIIGVHPGLNNAITIAKAGYLEELTNEPYIQNIDPGALRMGSVDGKVYALPIDTAYIAVFYNKAIFKENSLSIPKTWKEFTDLCEKLKQNGIVPISVGNKDLWVTQLIPYALAPTVIYKNNVNFDNDMYEGKAKFNGPEWKKVMDMYGELLEKGYFNEGPLSTSYDQSLALFAQGQTAMIIMGTWALPVIKNLNNDIDIGLFVLPASDDGDNWASSAVGGMIGIFSESKYKDEAKKFLAFFMRDDIYEFYLSETKNFPTVKGFAVDFDPAAKELVSQVTNSYNFLDQNWPAGVQDVFLRGYQEFFAGRPAEEVLAECDKEWETRIKELNK